MDGSATSPSRWPVHPIVAIVFVVALFLVAQVAATLLVGGAITALHLSSADGLSDYINNSVVGQFAFILLAEALTVTGLVLFMKARKLSLGSLGFRDPQRKDALRAVIAFVLYFAAYAVLVSALSPLLPGLDVSQKQDIGFNNAAGYGLVLTGIALIVLAPVTEELLMRGFLFTSLRSRKAPFLVATVITSVVFASAHLLGGEAGSGLLWIAAVDTFILSVVLCYLREKTGRLWAGIGVHALKNSLAFFMIFIMHVAR